MNITSAVDQLNCQGTVCKGMLTPDRRQPFINSTGDTLPVSFDRGKMHRNVTACPYVCLSDYLPFAKAKLTWPILMKQFKVFRVCYEQH